MSGSVSARARRRARPGVHMGRVERTRRQLRDDRATLSAPACCLRSAMPLAVWPAAGERRTPSLAPCPCPDRPSLQMRLPRACACLQRRLRGAPQHMQRLRARLRNDWSSCEPLPWGDGSVGLNRMDTTSLYGRGLGSGCQGVRNLYGVHRSGMPRSPRMPNHPANRLQRPSAARPGHRGPALRRSTRRRWSGAERRHGMVAAWSPASSPR